MKKSLYVVSAGLIIGTAAAVFILGNKRKKDASGESCEYKNFDDKVEEENDKSLAEVMISQDGPVYEDVKSSAIGKMYFRHEGAASVMRDSVKVIRENVKVSEEANDKIDDISAELDKMISED